MEKEFITKDYFDATFERFEKKFDDFSNLVMENFAQVERRLDDWVERVSEGECKALKHRVETLENSPATA